MDDGLYRGPIVDAHIHLWDLSLRRHPWLDPSDTHPLGELGPIRRDYLPPDYRADAAGQNVVAAVHVEAGWDPAGNAMAGVAGQAGRRSQPLRRRRGAGSRRRRSGRRRAGGL
jgi:predicted TIM-barrel fold metal-dependent hydrolase